MEIYEKIKGISTEIEDDLIRIRRNLHENPELSMDEYKTSEIILSELKKIDHIKIYDNLACGTGVMGILDFDKPGKTIVIRADIDALPVNEENNLKYKSKNPNCMHVCGHDAHITWVLGAAKILSKLKKDLKGSVKFIFQPGEEIGRGALEMIEEDNILENTDIAIAAHVWPSIDSGKIGIARNFAFGCHGSFQIEIIGKGGHGSWPNLSVNPIMIGSQICLTIPRILSEKIDATEPRVISIGSIHSGKKGVGNIIPETCIINGTIRAVKGEIIKKILYEIEKIVKLNCNLENASYKFTYNMSDYGVKNNRQLVELALDTGDNILGIDKTFIIEKDNLGGENFSEYSSRIPSIYLFAGIKNEEIQKEFSLHSPDFILDESVLTKVSSILAAMVYDINQYKGEIK